MHKGQKMTPEQLKRHGEARRGRPAWNKGKKTPEKTRQLQSESKIRHFAVPGARQRLSERIKQSYVDDPGLRVRNSEARKGKPLFARRGKKHSAEALRRMSEAHKGRPAWNKGKEMPAEQRLRQSETMKLLTTPAKRQRMSEATKQANINDPGLRIRNSEAHKGRPAWNLGKKTPEETHILQSFIAQLRFARGGHPRLGAIHSPATRLALSEAHKKRYADGAVSPMKGMTHTPAARLAISLSHLGLVQSTEVVRAREESRLKSRCSKLMPGQVVRAMAMIQEGGSREEIQKELGVKISPIMLQCLAENRYWEHYTTIPGQCRNDVLYAYLALEWSPEKIAEEFGFHVDNVVWSLELWIAALSAEDEGESNA